MLTASGLPKSRQTVERARRLKRDAVKWDRKPIDCQGQNPASPRVGSCLSVSMLLVQGRVADQIIPNCFRAFGLRDSSITDGSLL
jgi:hypothetical protein